MVGVVAMLAAAEEVKKRTWRLTNWLRPSVTWSPWREVAEVGDFKKLRFYAGHRRATNGFFQPQQAFDETSSARENRRGAKVVPVGFQLE